MGTTDPSSDKTHDLLWKFQGCTVSGCTHAIPGSYSGYSPGWGGVDRPAAPGSLLSAQVPSSTDLLKPTVLLHQRRKHTGAAGWWGLHIIITEAAEEGAEDATVPLFLQADVALGCWKEKSTLWPTAARTRGRNATRKLERAVAPQSPQTRRPT